jgi:hypothetical protein
LLYFKENIYIPTTEIFDQNDPEPFFDPYNFIIQALVGDRDIFYGLKQESQGKLIERITVLFPHASNYGGVDILNDISKRLLEGIVEPIIWYKMNAYQHCYLYDSLAAVVEDYSYSDLEQRIKTYPEMMGTDIDFNEFLNKYFFNTAFLINSDRFNEMGAVEKSQQGFNDPCLFGVINGLTPTKDEIQLKQLENNPFKKNNTDN